MEQLDAINLAERLTWEQEQQEQQEYWLHLEAASPLEKYPAKQHAKRVQELLAVQHGLIYLAGEPKRNNEDSDMPAPFRQRRYFYYLSGVNEPDCHLVYIINSNTLALFIPRINPARVIYEGSGPTPAEALDRYDIDQVYYADELEDIVVEWIKYYKAPLYLLHSSQNPIAKPIDDPVDSSTLQPAMNAARIIKDEHEIKLIRKANDISSQAHKEILANILRFKNEAQVEGLFRDVCISKLAKEQAYNPIAASGPNAGTLHYDSNNEDFEDRQLMCLDAGCEWELYASDITRTFPLSGSWPSQESKEIYHLVQRMQDACIERIKPGVRYLDLHILAHQVAIAGLLHLGLLHNGTAEEIFKAGTSRAFFPHGLGHHVGLEVHDVGQGELMSMAKTKREQHWSLYPDNFHSPVYSMDTCRSPCDPESPHLEEGMVVTIEPGIYFNTYLLNMNYLQDPVHSKYINIIAVNRYLPVGGVRIEDDILVTSKGYENLTTAPKGEAMMEIIRSHNAQWPFVSASINLEPVSSTKHAEREVPEPRLKPALKPSTQPDYIHKTKSEEKADKRKSVDFEPFGGPSLYAGFSRTSTTDENVQRWRESRRTSMVRCHSPESITPRSKKPDSPRIPVCGEDTSTVIHAYLDFPALAKTSNVSVHSYTADKKPACHKCTVLVQTLDRLRQNLSNTEQMQSKPSVQPAVSRAPEMTERPRTSRTMPILPSQTAPTSSKDTLKEKILTLEQKIGVLEKKLSLPLADVQGLPNRQSLPNLRAEVDSSAARKVPASLPPVTSSRRLSRQSWSQALSRGSDIRTEQLNGLTRFNTIPVKSNRVATETHTQAVAPLMLNFYQDQLIKLEAKNKARLLRQSQDPVVPPYSSSQPIPQTRPSQLPVPPTTGPTATTLDTLGKQTNELAKRSQGSNAQAPQHLIYDKSPFVCQSGPSGAVPPPPSNAQIPASAKAHDVQQERVKTETKCERCRIMDMPCSGETPCHFCSQLRLPCEPSSTVRKSVTLPSSSSSTTSDQESLPPSWAWSHKGLHSRHVPDPTSRARPSTHELREDRQRLRFLEQQNRQRLEQARREQRSWEAAYYAQLSRSQAPADNRPADNNTSLHRRSGSFEMCHRCGAYGCNLHTAVEASGPSNPAQDGPLDGLTNAMDRLWTVRQDLQRMGGAAWGDEGREGRREWHDRVEGDVRRAFNNQNQ